MNEPWNEDPTAWHISLALAKARFGPGVVMSGEHNPTPQEVADGKRLADLVRHNSPHKKDLLALTDVIYGGIDWPADDDPMFLPSLLRAIADWLDKIDDVTDEIVVRHGATYKVGRTVQKELREQADDLDD